MKITVAQESGFCFGVKLAIDNTNKQLEQGKKIWCLGQLIHNNSVTDGLVEKGLIVVDDIEQVPNGQTIIFRSHGVGKKTYQKAEQKNLNVVDCTCPFVSKIHKIVKKYSELGYKIVIVGKSTHPEVIGIKGWCGDSAIVLQSVDDVEKLIVEKERADKEHVDTRFCIVSQTTSSKQLWQNITKKIENIDIKTLDFFDTICYTTNVRQEQTKILASQSDAMFVLGNKNSSNTNELFKICLQYCKDSFLIQTVKELEYTIVEQTNEFCKVGITAGASTPQEFIDKVVTVLHNKYLSAKAEV